jgi:hypothetical protein
LFNLTSFYIGLLCVRLYGKIWKTWLFKPLWQNTAPAGKAVFSFGTQRSWVRIPSPRFLAGATGNAVFIGFSGSFFVPAMAVLNALFDSVLVPCSTSVQPFSHLPP